MQFTMMAKVIGLDVVHDGVTVKFRFPDAKSLMYGELKLAVPTPTPNLGDEYEVTFRSLPTETGLNQIDQTINGAVDAASDVGV